MHFSAHDELSLFYLLLALGALLVAAAMRRLPVPLLLVCGGLLLGFVPGLPRFCGGAVGYAGYDTVRYGERLPHPPADDRGLGALHADG